MFKYGICACHDLGFVDWAVFADLWIFINGVGAVYFAVAIDLFVERAESYA